MTEAPPRTLHPQRQVKEIARRVASRPCAQALTRVHEQARIALHECMERLCPSLAQPVSRACGVLPRQRPTRPREPRRHHHRLVGTTNAAAHLAKPIVGGFGQVTQALHR